MDVAHQRVAAPHISKTDAKVCTLVPGKRKGTFTREVTIWGATTNQSWRYAITWSPPGSGWW